jgi:hypothetical protein
MAVRIKWGMHMGRPRNPPPPSLPNPWETPAIANEVSEILTALEVPAIDAETRGVFQRILYRQKHFGGDARGRVIFIIRCITESSGNEGALIGPIVSAVSSCVTPELTDRGLELIEAFDRISLLAILETMRGLDLFGEKSIGHYLGIILHNKLAAILKPAVSKPAPVRAKPKAKRPKRRPADQPVRMAA